MCCDPDCSAGLEDKGSMVRVRPVPQNRWFTIRWRKSGGSGRHWGGLQRVLFNNGRYPLVGGTRECRFGGIGLSQETA